MFLLLIRGLAMKFNILAVWAFFFIITLSGTVSARTVTPVLDKNGNAVIDQRGNCARSKWLSDQCCDMCGFDAPEPLPETAIIQKQKKTTYVDLVRQSIYFEIDKDNIDQSDEQRIQDVINEISKSAAIRDVKMVGYADRIATNKYNMDLSKRRASNVLNYFRNRNFLNNVTVGFGFFGEERPVTQCPMNVPLANQISCLQADRRVDIEVELLRERIETYQEKVTLPPAYPRPGTAGVEVYSQPVDPRTIQYDNTPAETPAVPVAPVQSIDVLQQ